jgi:hypothetical protein
MAMMTIAYPSRQRAFRALLVAPLLPVGILFLLDAVDRTVQFGAPYIVGAAMLAFYILVFVEFFTILFGSITLALIWKRIPFNLLICMLVGGLIAALPFLLYGLISMATVPLDYDAWDDGHQTVVHGVKTAYGHWRDFVWISEVFGLGMIGGGFFWWLCRPKQSPEPEVE